MEWAAFGLRDAILLLVAAAAIYLVVMLLKLTRIGRRREPFPDLQEPPLIDKRAPAISEPVQPETSHEPTPGAVPPVPTFEWSEVKELFGTAAPPEAPPQPPEQPAVQRQGGFGEHLAEHLARADMEMEVQRMRDEMERMRCEMEELRAARRVSPQYAEAMELAQRGLTAQDVADRLGISLAEAELVHALSRGRQNYDEGDNNGGNGYAAGSDEFGHPRRG
jgi:hypothetical protein